MRPGVPPYRYKLYALLGVAVLGLSVFGVVASYTRMFVPVVSAQVLADRSGLFLDRKADVTLHGITVGEARNIQPTGGGKARIDIAIDREYIDRIPANAGARIIAPTVFGAKFVDLVPPPSPSPRAIEDGTVIQATDVATETDSVFDNLMNLLTAVKPAKLNATLGAAATALRGRGAELGRFISDLNTYLTRFNPTLPTVDKDLRMLPDVAKNYADVAPDLLRITDNAATLGKTIKDKEAGLHALLLSVTRASGNGRGLVSDNGTQLVDLLDTARPTTELLAYYSPEFPCLFNGMNTLRTSSARAVGGEYNGIHGVVKLLAGQPGYQKGVDDPVVGAKGPPRCSDFPLLNAHGPHYKFNDGVDSVDFYRRTTHVVGPCELARRLLGPSVKNFLTGGCR